MQTKIEDLREEIMGWEIGCERLRQQVRELQHERCDNQSYDTRQYNYGFHGPQNSINKSDDMQRNMFPWQTTKSTKTTKPR